MELRKRLAVGLAWMFAGSFSEQAANFVVFILLARLLGPEVFGLAAMATLFVLFAEFLVRETMTETLIAREEIDEGHRDAVFWILGGFSVAIVLLIIACADPIARIFSEPRVADYIVWATPSVLFIGFSGVPVAALRRGLEFRMLAIRATAGVLAGGVAGVAMALLDYGVFSLIGQRVVQVFVNNLLAWIAHPWRPGFRATRRHVRDVASFSTKMVGLRASELVSLNAPTLVIGSFLGPTLLGQYTIAWRLIEILSFVLTTPIRYVALPAFAHLNRIRESPGALLETTMRLSSLVTFAAFFGMAAVAAPALEVVFGLEWTGAAPALRVLCLVGVYLSIERLHQAFLVALGRAGRIAAFSLLEACVALAAMTLVVDFGILGVTAAFAAAYYCVWPFRIAWLLRIAELPAAAYLKLFVLPLCGALLIYPATRYWQAEFAGALSTPALLLSSIVIGVLCYGLFIGLTMRREVGELLRAVTHLRDAATTDQESNDE